jgi:hypothetical protein
MSDNGHAVVAESLVVSDRTDELVMSSSARTTSPPQGPTPTWGDEFRRLDRSKRTQRTRESR